MKAYTTHVFDFARGVDVMRGSKVLMHFDGPEAYELAQLHAAEAPGRYIRYYGKKS